MSGSRKDDHLSLAAAHQREQRPGETTDWDDVRLVHHALAGADAAETSLRAELPGAGGAPISWPLPFYVNGMTGGSELTGKVNEALGEAAAQTGIAIATGSMSQYLREPECLPTFRVLRDRNPDGFVMANLSADATPEQARRAVGALGADALQIHVNAVQETVMPEGSRGFPAWLGNIEAVVAALEADGVPVVVKEVGNGMSRETLTGLAGIGVRIADTAGRGGTNFARIENSRRAGQDYAYLHDFGQSAPASLLDAASLPAGTPLPALLASGGVRHPYDVVRGLALGARAVGVAGTFLRTVLGEEGLEAGTEGVDRLVAQIQEWAERVRELQALLGVRDAAEWKNTDVLVTGRLAEDARLRGTDLAAFANRRAARA